MEIEHLRFSELSLNRELINHYTKSEKELIIRNKIDKLTQHAPRNNFELP